MNAMVGLLVACALLPPVHGSEPLDVIAPPKLAGAAKVCRSEFAKVEKNLLTILSMDAPGASIKLRLVPGSSPLALSGDEATIGAGYKGFPKTRYGFDVELARLALTKWAGEFSEPIWGPALGDYICIEAVKRSNYYTESFNDIRNRYRKALKFDPDFRRADLSGHVPDYVRRAKGLWMIWQFQVRYPPDFLRNYLRARKQMAPNGAKTPDDVAAIVSRAAGTEQFSWFQFHGTKVSPKNTKLKF